MKFSFHPEAELNLSIDYYEDRAEGLGMDFAVEVYSTIQRIIEHPKSFLVLRSGSW